MKPVLVINDLHIPFQRKDILSLIGDCKNNLDAIIFGGDIIDCKSISSFPDLDDITIEFEVEKAIEFMTEVRKIVGKKVKLIVLKGNHELRWEKYISKMHDKKLYKFINPNILEMLRDGMTLYSDGETKHIEGDKDLIIINDWYVNYKGVIVCHPINFYSQPTKLAITAVQYFLGKENFNTLICAHNHHQSTCFYDDIWVIESGCCCQEMSYVQGKTTTKIQDYGLVYLTFDENEKVDINYSQVYKMFPENNKSPKTQL